MILCAHADAGFLNKSQSRSCAGAHIFLLQNEPFPQFNGAVLSIAQIIKFAMASAAESELAAGGPNPKAQSKRTTPQQQGLLTIVLSLAGVR